MIDQKKLNKLLNVNNSNRKLFGVLLKSMRKIGILKLNENKYHLEDNSLLKRIDEVWRLVNYIDFIYSPNWMSFDLLSHFIKQYFINNEIDIIGILCPTYSKTGFVGLNNEIGQTTKKAISNMISFLNACNEICPECDIKAICYYWDLSLEQYELQPHEDWEIQIKNNLSKIEDYIKDKGYDLKIKRMSEDKYLLDKIWFYWEHDLQLIENNIWLSKRIKERNSLFYEQILHRSKEKSDARSELCICSYSYMGEYFISTYNNPLMLYTANIYEKGVAYNFLNNDRKMFIIYLKKDDWSIIELSHEKRT